MSRKIRRHFTDNFKQQIVEFHNAEIMKRYLSMLLFWVIFVLYGLSAQSGTFDFLGL